MVGRSVVLVVVVLVEVVVVEDWQTEMVTVLPVASWVLAAGFCASTKPGLAPPGHAVSKVVLATRPAAVMACWAADGDLTDHAGHGGTTAGGDHDRDGGVRRHRLSRPGFWDETSPPPYWSEQAPVWPPTLRMRLVQDGACRRGRLPDDGRYRNGGLAGRHGQDHLRRLLDLAPARWRLTEHGALRLVAARHVVHGVGQPHHVQRLNGLCQRIALDRRHRDDRDVRAGADHQVDR